MRTRLNFVLFFFGLLFLTLFFRAAFLQIIPDDRLKKLQTRLFQTTVHLDPRRGAITDRHGRDLAISFSAQSLYADPQLIKEPRRTSRMLGKILGAAPQMIYAKIKDPSRRFVWIQRKIDPSQVKKIKELEIQGLGFIDDWKRVYPNDGLLSQTLGFVNSEGKGLEGLELAYQSLLEGDPMKVAVRRDARGRPLMTDSLLFTEHPEGKEVRLTIDSEMQFQLETELANAVAEFDADGAVGIILDAKTSAIRAMASNPSYDLNAVQSSPPDHRRNRVVTDAFEPGSTMKSFVVAKGLKEKILQPNTKYFCENGVMKIGKRIIREAETSHNFGHLTVTEILAKSSNIGTTKIAFQLGAERLREAYLEFGFGDRTQIDFPGETRGILHNLPWNPHLLSNISFGHGMTASPLQIANAYAALVNGGNLNKPYLVESIKDQESGKAQAFPAQLIRKVLTPQESNQMRMMLAAVTAEEGTGKSARVKGFIVGGKTGTAQKVNPKSRGYLPGAYISSFAGFIPAQDPQFVIYVAIDHPKKAFYGSTVAAPLFARLAGFAARREGLPPSEPLLSPPSSRRNLAGSATPSESSVIGKKKIDSTIAELPESDISKKAKAALQDGASLVMPTVLNQPLREALHRLQPLNKPVEIKGSGRVSDVWPLPGQSLEGVDKIIIQLE